MKNPDLQERANRTFSWINFEFSSNAADKKLPTNTRFHQELPKMTLIQLSC